MYNFDAFLERIKSYHDGDALHTLLQSEIAGAEQAARGRRRRDRLDPAAGAVRYAENLKGLMTYLYHLDSRSWPASVSPTYEGAFAAIRRRLSPNSQRESLAG